MDEKSDEILNHIESQRNELGRNLEELETRVKRTADWRTHYENNPMLLLGAALGGGILLGALVGRGGSDSSDKGYNSSKSWSPSSRYSSPSSSEGSSRGFLDSPAASHAKQQATEAMDKIKGALIAFGTMKAKEFLAQAIPGIEQHLGDFPFGSSGKPDESRSTGFYDRSATSSANPSPGTESASSTPKAGAQGNVQYGQQQQPVSAGTGPNPSVGV